MQKAANIAGLEKNMRVIPTRGNPNSSDNSKTDEEGTSDEKAGSSWYAMDADDLLSAMREDITRGLKPMFVSANVGSTNTCAIDSVRAIGEACRR